MSLLNTQSRTRPWPLLSNSNDAPAWATSSVIKFFLDSIPLTTRGNLANYVPCLKLTAYGSVNTTGNQADRLQWEDICAALYTNFDLQGAWHGRPIAAQHMRGATARIWSLISGGYQMGSRFQPGQRACDGAKAFRHVVYLPLSHALGKNGARYTSQLALLYQNAHLEINTPTGAVTTRTGVPITINSANLRCSAVLLPEPSLRLAPGVEWIEHQQSGAQAGSDTVTLNAIGTTTALEGVEPGAGIDTILALCFREGLLGSWTASDLSRFSSPFTDVTQTQDLDYFVNILEQVSAKGERPRNQQVEDLAAGTPVAIGQVIDRSGFPYGYNSIADTDYTATPPGDGSKLPDSLLCYPIVVSGPELELTKVQRFEGNATYYRTVAAIQASTIDRTLVHQYKSFTPAKIEDFRQQLITSGLARDVLGTTVIAAKPARNESGNPMPAASARFFPLEYRPASEDPSTKKTPA